MASIDVFTADYEQILHDQDVVDATINGSGHLIITHRDGTTEDLGNVIGPQGTPGTPGAPGAAGSTLLQWNSATAYTTGQVVGYAGRTYKALSNNTNKPPGLFNSIWTMINAGPTIDWATLDPYFTHDTTLGSWETFWKTGTSTAARTTTAGEFETGIGGLKVSLAASSTQRIYEKGIENLVRGGEVISVEVRAKLSAAAAGITMNAALFQNDSGGDPAPLASGLSQAAAAEGAQALSTTWTTYHFNFVAANAKPRAVVNITLDQAAGNSSIVCIDRIVVTRGWKSGKVALSTLWNTSVFGNYGSGWTSPVAFYRLLDQVHIEGLMSVGGFGWATNVSLMAAGKTLPTWARPPGNKMFTQYSSSGADRVDVNSDGNILQQQYTLASGGWLDLDLNYNVAGANP